MFTQFRLLSGMSLFTQVLCSFFFPSQYRRKWCIYRHGEKSRGLLCSLLPWYYCPPVSRPLICCHSLSLQIQRAMGVNTEVTVYLECNLLVVYVVGRVVGTVQVTIVEFFLHIFVLIYACVCVLNGVWWKFCNRIKFKHRLNNFVMVRDLNPP